MLRLKFLLLQMGDPSIEVNEENRDAAQEAKRKAMEAVCEGILLLVLCL